MTGVANTQQEQQQLLGDVNCGTPLSPTNNNNNAMAANNNMNNNSNGSNTNNTMGPLGKYLELLHNS